MSNVYRLTPTRIIDEDDDTVVEGKGGESPFAHVASVLAEANPGALSSLVKIERRARERAEASFFARLERHRHELERIEEKIDGKAGGVSSAAAVFAQLQRDTRGLQRELAEGVRTTLGEVRDTVEQLRGRITDSERSIEHRYAVALEQMSQEREELLSEVRSRYDAMFRQWRGERTEALEERDAIHAQTVAELRQAIDSERAERTERHRADREALEELVERYRDDVAKSEERREAEATAFRSSLEAFTERMNQELDEALEKKNSAQARADELDEENRKLRADLVEALASRERVMDRLGQIEEQLRGAMEKQRTELELRKHRIEILEEEVTGLNNEVDYYRNELVERELVEKSLRSAIETKS